MKRKEQPFTIQKRPLEETVTFLKDKDPSIIGKTCQMLSAIKMTMHPEQGLKYLIGVIEQIRQDKRYRFKEDTLSQLQIDALDNENYLRKILKTGDWVYSIRKYIVDKLYNSLKTEKRHKRLEVPYYVMTEEGGQEKITENPHVDYSQVCDLEREKLDEIRTIELMERIDELFRRAKLRDREKTIYRYKETTDFKEEVIAKILSVSGSTVTKDYAKAKEKLKTFRSQHPEFETYLRR